MPKIATPWKDPRTSIYYLKIQIPDDLKESLGKSWKKKSLGTKDHREAIKLFCAEYTKVLAEFEDLRSKMSMSLKDAQIIAARYDSEEKGRVDSAENWDEWLSIHPTKKTSPLTGELAVPQELEGDGDLQFFLKHDDLWELARLEGGAVDKLILGAGFRVNRQSNAYEELLRHVCHTRMQTEFHALRRFKGDWKDVSAAPIASEKLTSETSPKEIGVVTKSPSLAASKYNLKQLIIDFTNYKSGGWGGSSRSAASLILNTFEQFIGSGVDPESITREQLRDFKKILSKLPLNYSNSEKFKGMTLTQIASLASSENLRRLSEGSQYTKFTYIVGLLGFGLLEEKVSKNRAEELNRKSENSKEAVVYNNEDLSRIFEYFSDPSDVITFWIPRIALCGLRQNEICQLKKSSFKHFNSIPFIELDKKLKLKNKNAERRIPIPNWLVDIGLLEFVEQSKNDRLFDVKSSYYSKRFNRELKQILSKGNFHSFRHTFRAYCRRDAVDKEIADYLGGWRSNEYSTGDQYGNDFTVYLSRLQTGINKLQYPSLLG
jgi:integrase